LQPERFDLDKERGIAPGSSVDTSIRRALQDDIVKYEALLVTRQGTAVFPNSSLPVRVVSQHDRQRIR
jgi:hypothetical protein